MARVPNSTYRSQGTPLKETPKLIFRRHRNYQEKGQEKQTPQSEKRTFAMTPRGNKVFEESKSVQCAKAFAPPYCGCQRTAQLKGLEGKVKC